jgi:hypothetical protein
MKKNKIIMPFIAIIIVFCITACSSKSNIVGKYVSLNDENHCLTFNDDGSFIDNERIDLGTGAIVDDYVYEIDNKGIIPIIYIRYYMDQEANNKENFGYLYSNYICNLWDGISPIANQNTTINRVPEEIDNLEMNVSFKDDNTFQYYAIYNGEIIDEDNGSYSIIGNKIECIGEKYNSIFFDTDIGVLSAIYTKEI